jgi:Beta-lactamase superfamily domain
MIDCGKSFNCISRRNLQVMVDGAITLFPKFGLRQVDVRCSNARLILGFTINSRSRRRMFRLGRSQVPSSDPSTDLRSLTLRSTFAPVQDHIPIYTSPETLAAISRMFPYMIDSKAATGGGDIPSFTWYPFESSKPFIIPSCGNISVTPLPVEHGMYFSEEPFRPYMCMGFRIGEVSYISDASRISDETKSKIEGSRVLILDALREKPHGSHFSFDEVFSLGDVN